MPTTPHIGVADGLTVPFALAAGLAAAVSSTDVIVTAGLAEIVAGAIAMGLGGYLAARTDAAISRAAALRAKADTPLESPFVIKLYSSLRRPRAG